MAAKDHSLFIEFENNLYLHMNMVIISAWMNIKFVHTDTGISAGWTGILCFKFFRITWGAAPA